MVVSLVFISILYILPIFLSYVGTRFMFSTGEWKDPGLRDFFLMFVPGYNWGITLYIAPKLFNHVGERMVKRVKEMDRLNKFVRRFFGVKD